MLALIFNTYLFCNLNNFKKKTLFSIREKNEGTYLARQNDLNILSCAI